MFFIVFKCGCAAFFDRCSCCPFEVSVYGFLVCVVLQLLL